MAAFPLGRVAGAADLGGLKMLHCQQQRHIVLLTPHQDGRSKGGDAITPFGPWSTSGPISLE